MSGTPHAIESDWIARAQNMQDLIRHAADAIEAGRMLVPEVVAALQEQGLYRMLLPRSLGGGEVEPLVFARAVEALATADASTAWCVAQACGCSLSAAYLAPEVARDVFGPPHAVLAWGPLPRTARAVPVSGGFKISGTWLFASGSRHASWLGAHCVLVDEQGQPHSGPDGRPVDRTFLVRREAAEIEDVWHVMGLRGTGSDNYRLKDVFVPASHSFARDRADERRESGPLYQFSFLSIYGVAFAAVSFGIAQAMLDAFRQLAPSKIPQGTPGLSLQDSPRVQAQLAGAEARLRSARAYLHQTLARLWERAVAGQPFSTEERIDLRLSSTAGMQVAREVAAWTYHAAGATAIFSNQPFERRFRDIHTASQQVQAHESNFELAGRALLGLPAGSRL